MNLHIDPSEFRDIIEAAVDAALRRFRDEQPTDEGGQVMWGKRRTAKEMSVSEATVDRWRQTAGLPFIKIDGLVLFRPESLHAWAEARESK